MFKGGQELSQADAGDQVLARIFLAEGFYLFDIQVIAGHTETVAVPDLVPACDP